MTEFLMKFTQLKGMGLNITSGISNILFGVSAVINHANGNVEYGGKDLVAGMGLLLRSFSQSPSNNKVYNIAKNLNILFETIDSDYESPKKSRYNPVKHFDPYIFQRKTEYVNQILTLLAMMNKRKVTLKSGKTVSLYEVFDESGNVQYDLLNDEDKNKWLSEIKPSDSNEYSKFRNSVVQLNTYLHGNYDTAQPIMGKKVIINRLLIMFRSWVPMGFASRFLSEQYDERLGRRVKGRWQTYGDLGFTKSIKTLMKQAMYMKEEKAFEGIANPLDIENMRKNISEIALIIAINALMVMLRWSIEDDDDEKEVDDYMAQSLVNQLYRAEQDFFFYIDPGTAWQVLKDPIPATKTFMDVQRAIEGGYKYSTNDDYRGQPPLVKIAKVFPFTNQWPKIEFLSTEDIQERQ
jgi:hypothetical protein